MAIIQTLSIVRVVYAYEALHQGHRHGGRMSYAPFVILLALAFALPSNTLNANLVNRKGLNSQLAAPPATTYEMSSNHLIATSTRP
jgi:putative membrane protein